MTRTGPLQTRLWSLGIAGLSLASVLAGCGSAPGIDITTDVSSVVIVRGASADLTVSLTRTGEVSADVQLSVSGLPDQVDSSFSPVTLSGSNLESTLTLAVDKTASEGTHNVKVFAVGSGLAAETEVELTITSLDVTGTVLLAPDRPWTGIEVEGPSGSTTTAADGTFTFVGLAVPYDLTLHTDSGSGAVHVFEGLTSSGPELYPVAPSLIGFLADTANLSGTLSGSSLPLPANHAARVCLEGIDKRVFNACQALGAGEDSYDLAVLWPASGSLQATLQVLTYELNGSGDAPATYVGYASTEVDLADGDVTVLDVALADVPSTTTLSGEVAVTGGGSPERVYAGLRFGPNLTIPLFHDGSGADDFALPMPVLPDVSYDVVAVIGFPERLAWKTASGPEAGTLAIPAAPQQIAPDDAVGGVDLATPFEVSAPEPSVFTYVWDGGMGAPRFALTTTKATVRVPDGSGFGMPLPPNAAYEWQVFRVAGNEVDVAARIDHDEALGALEMMSLALGGPGFSGAGTLASSTLRTFVTAP